MKLQQKCLNKIRALNANRVELPGELHPPTRRPGWGGAAGTAVGSGAPPRPLTSLPGSRTPLPTALGEYIELLRDPRTTGKAAGSTAKTREKRKRLALYNDR